MQSKIQILPDHIINQIAAGEVIENCASVIKELVENSIDAASKIIRVEIKQGGLQQIRVEDDGVGMSEGDALLSLKRHATSKLFSFNDLLKISTMGFRGEALASIASISKLDIKTSEDSVGVHIKTENGQVISNEKISRTKGTTIDVRSLFYNVPVRKTFQKSIALMTADINKVMMNLSLANPQIGFTFISNEKILLNCESFDLPFEKAFEIRIKEILGVDFFKSCTQINFSEDNIKITGLIGLPIYAKKSRSLQYLSLNRRYVSCPMISNFIKEAYKTRLGEKEYPIFALHLEMPPQFIDVNVHPQKKEVRLKEEYFLKNIIKKAISGTFQKASFFSSDEKVSLNSIFFEEVPSQSFVKIEKESLTNNNSQMLFEKNWEEDFLFQDSFIFKNFLFIPANNLASKMDIQEDSLLLLNLNNAVSRILFEDLIKSEKRIVKQNLGIALILDLSKDEIMVAESNLDNFSKMGFEVRIVGEKTIAIDSIPSFFDEKDLEDTFIKILSDIKLFGISDGAETLILKKMAKGICFMAKSNKKRYSKEEAKIIFKNLLKCSEINIDPLGNTTIVFLGKEDLENLIK